MERFGSALLATPSAESETSATPTENLSPKTRTAPNKATPLTLESPMPPTDQLGLRGTGRQAVPKVTSEEAVPKLPASEFRTTVVEAKAFRELAPTRPATLPAEEVKETKSAKELAPTRRATLPAEEVKETKSAQAPAFVPPPPPASLVTPPKIAPPAAPPAPENLSIENPSIEFVAPSTKELQQDLVNKPFFTRMLTPNAKNPQHRYLLFAVPLVLLAALVVLIIFLWQR